MSSETSVTIIGKESEYTRRLILCMQVSDSGVATHYVPNYMDMLFCKQNESGQ